MRQFLVSSSLVYLAVAAFLVTLWTAPWSWPTQGHSFTSRRRATPPRDGIRTRRGGVIRQDTRDTPDPSGLQGRGRVHRIEKPGRGPTQESVHVPDLGRKRPRSRGGQGLGRAVLRKSGLNSTQRPRSRGDQDLGAVLRKPGLNSSRTKARNLETRYLALIIDPDSKHWILV